MTLYQIDSAIMDLVNPETGELVDYEAFAELQMARDEKIENTVLFIKNLEAEAAEIKAEETRLAERRKAKEARAKRFREYVGFALDGEKFETARCAVSFRNSTALSVSDAGVAADWLKSNGHFDLVTYAAPTLDKRNVAALVKSGSEIPGVQLEQRRSTVIK